MIASNYRRHPDAMALQLVLAFGRCTWHTARPTTRIGRAVRAERSRLVKQTPQLVRWVARSVPAWWKAAQRAAKALAKQVKAAMLALVWDAAPSEEPSDDLAELFKQADRFEEEHEDSCRRQCFTTRVQRPHWSPTWQHYGVGHGGLIASDYRA